MGESLRAFLDAVEVFLDRVAAVNALPLAVAVGFHLSNVLLRTYAWRNIIAAAYPAARVRWRHTFGAYEAGVAVNAVLPARAGDPVKLFLVHGRVEGSSYPTLGATLVAETIVDAVIGTSILLWAWRSGLLPLPSLPTLPAFEVSWVARHSWTIPVTGVVLTLVLWWVGGRVRRFWARVGQGLVILRSPGRYLSRVAVFQVMGWGCRLGAAMAFLEAFNVHATLQSAVLVQVASSVATSLPATPGGLGPKQALLVVLLAGEAARSDILAFSVGMEAVILVVNLLVGGASLLLMHGGLRVHRSVPRAAGEVGETPGPGP